MATGIDSISNTRKRKNHEDQDRGSLSDREAKTRKVSNALGSTTTKIEWPEFLQKLEKTHKALNLVFTFCCTRKYLATKFDTIKSAVEGHIGRELQVENVAQIVALRPSGMSFTYVDEAKLQIDVRGTEKKKDIFLGARVTEWHVAEPMPPTTGATADPQQATGGHAEVLIFEFIDGDLKRQASNKKTNQPTAKTRKLKDESLKMPVFSQKQMLGLIEKRNAKFSSAVDAFLIKCQAEGIDPEEKLREESLPYIPKPSGTHNKLRKPDRVIIPTIPKERKTISEIITEIKESHIYKGQIVQNGHRVFDPQVAIYGNLNFQLSQCLVNALYNTKNITQLYSHQAEAINNLHDGFNVIVATSTSSGKSLIYQIPVLHELERDPQTRALYIFPTKALAQDQRRSLKDMMRYMRGLEETIVETFDGDTDLKDRNLIRDEGRIIFTNPDMLHVTILPHEERWRSFLQSLKYVVVDEIHIYNGLFGSHVALIMRRLRRVCAALGNRHIKFISCSATVANPLGHFKSLFGIDKVKVTNFDGSPSGRKEFLCWNTPYKDPGDPSSGRGDIISEASKLFCQLVLRGVRVIAFCRIRRGCESLVGAVKQELAALGRSEYMARVMGYRGGYTPQDRRQIESQMFEGKLIGIIATSALELGVDIGSLDAVVSVGFPYSIANLRQQSGRAGRRNKDSLSILIGDSFPTDQHYMQNPDEIFTKANTELQVDLQNLLVLEGHLQCAAHEMPICIDKDTEYFSELLREIAEERLIKDELGFYHCHESFRPTPSKYVSIRDTEEDHFAIVDVSHGQNIILEELEASRAFFTLYDGGIYLHQGNTYLVKELNLQKKIARVELVRVDWTTQQCNFTDIDPNEIEAIRRIPESLSRAFYGQIKITKTVFGFFKLDKQRRILDAIQVDNPPIISYSKGMWLDVPRQALEILTDKRLNIVGAIHAAEHAILSLMPKFVVSMPGDVRTECKASHKEFTRRFVSRKRPARLTFYDAKGGASGSGISTKAFEYIDLLLKQALQRVQTCCCHEGCMECVTSELCKHANEVMSKVGAEVILKSFLNLDIDFDALPMGPEEPASLKFEVFEEAQPILPNKKVEILQATREGPSIKHLVVGSVDVQGIETEIKLEPQD
ncbi:ATP-dependent helicase [Podosphaera aphanis]|nr:ATP-dependent helicase [Podosphaera aphanis]